MQLARQTGEGAVVQPDVVIGILGACELARPRIDGVGALSRRRAEDIVLRAVGIFALPVGLLGLGVVVEIGGQIGLLRRHAPGAGNPILIAAGLLGLGSEHIQLAPVELGLGDHVDHPGNGIRPVDRGGSVLQDVHVVDDALGQHVEVEGRHATARAGRPGATPVQQEHGAVGAEATQRDGLRPHATVGHESRGGQGVHLGRARGDGRGLQQRRSVADTAQLGILALDHLDRIGAVELVLADARAGHNDSRDGVIGLVSLGLVRKGLGGVGGSGGCRLKGRRGLDGRGVGPLGRSRGRCQGDNATDHGRNEECLFADTHESPETARDCTVKLQQPRLN